MKKCIFTGSLLLTALLFVTPTDAKIAWSEPEVLFTGQFNDKPNISVNELNQAIVIWSQRIEDKEQARTILYSDGWQENVKCSPRIQRYVMHPQVSLNNWGHAIAVWQKYGLEQSSLRVAKYADGAWGESISKLLIPHGQGNMANLDIALNDAENGVAICLNQSSESDILRACEYENGEWKEIQSISSKFVTFRGENPRIRNVKLSMNDVGDKMLVWDMFNGTHSRIIASHKMQNSEDWSDPQVISPVLCAKAGRIESPHVAFNNNGLAIAVWRVYAEKSLIGMATFAAGMWSEPTIATSEHVGWITPSVALNNLDHAMIIWHANDQLYAQSRINGTWNQAQVISQSGWSPNDHQLILNDLDQAVVIYNASEVIETTMPFPPAPPTYGFVATFAEGKWDCPVRISPRVLDVGLNLNGKAFVLGQEGDALKATCGHF